MSAPRKQPMAAVTGVFQRGDRWCARVPVARHPSGTGWKYRTVTAATRAAAVERAAVVERERDWGRYDHLSSTCTFAVWAKRWLYTELRDEGRAESTVAVHAKALGPAMEWFSARPLREVTAEAVEAYYRSLCLAGYSISRVHVAERSLRLCLGSAWHKGLVPRNPAAAAAWWHDK